MSEQRADFPGPRGRTGLFVSFEGPEGAGKSTQAEALAQALQRRGLEVVLVREPGGTGLGEALRELIQNPDGPGEVCPEAELLMFGASRAQLVRSVIRPALARRQVVICDRFADSTSVYQGCGRGLPGGFIRALHEFTVGATWPDRTFLLDVPVEQGFARKRRGVAGALQLDRIERETVDFHERVRRGFLDLARREPGRFVVLDGMAPFQNLHERILEAVLHALG